MTAARQKRVCWITTTPFIANAFLRPHLQELGKHYDVSLAVNLEDGYALRLAAPGVRVLGLPLRRKISLWWDAVAFFSLLGTLLRGRYDAVHSFAPKAGLLGMLAAWLAGVPVRLHTFQGEVWASRSGPMRAMLKAADRLIARLATHVLVVGAGERSFLESEAVLAAGRGIVLGKGSIAGVDAARFRPDPQARARVRAQLGAGDAEVVLLYLGRLLRDKGVLDLASAFQSIGAQVPEAMLAFVGPDEEAIAPAIRSSAGAYVERLKFVGYTEQPEQYLAAADLVCLPSYREGFSTVILEAAACGVPAVASRIYGTQDAIVDQVTGRYCCAGDVRELADALLELTRDASLRERMGRAARDMVLQRFRAEKLVAEMVSFYRRVLRD